MHHSSVSSVSSAFWSRSRKAEKLHTPISIRKWKLSGKAAQKSTGCSQIVTLYTLQKNKSRETLSPEMINILVFGVWKPSGWNVRKKKVLWVWSARLHVKAKKKRKVAQDHKEMSFTDLLLTSLKASGSSRVSYSVYEPVWGRGCSKEGYFGS